MHQQEILQYIERVPDRTRKVVVLIPREQIEWTYAEGKFTLGDLVRHLAAINRWMFAENASLRPSSYPGHARALAEGYDALLAYFDAMYAEQMEILRNADFTARCATPGGAELPVWKWLRAMTEHEIHHRGQIYMYLAMLGIPTPPIYGLTEEEVHRRSM